MVVVVMVIVDMVVVVVVVVPVVVVLFACFVLLCFVTPIFYVFSVDPDAILRIVREHKLRLTTVLITHHHWYVFLGRCGIGVCSCCFIVFSSFFLLFLSVCVLLVKVVILAYFSRDHSIGNLEIKRKVEGIRVVGSDVDKTRIYGITTPVIHNEKLKLGKLVVTALHTPCHTKGFFV